SSQAAPSSRTIVSSACRGLTDAGHQVTTITPPDSEVYFINVCRRLDAQFDEVFREPVARTFSPLVAKKNEKVPIGVVFACRTEGTHELVVRDTVDPHA